MCRGCGTTLLERISNFNEAMRFLSRPSFYPMSLALFGILEGLRKKLLQEIQSSNGGVK